MGQQSDVAKAWQKPVRGQTLSGAIAVTAVLGMLMGLGYGVWRGTRASARAVQAVSNLRQVGVALDLFFNKYSSYPPQGADLVAVLAPYVRDVNVFTNPLADEETPGQTLSRLYREPNLGELDSAGHYLTALASSDGSVAVVLKTGARVDRYTNLSLPNDPASIVAILSNETPPTPAPEEPPQPEPEPGTGSSVGGEVNLNPNNNGDFEFDLLKPDGTHITRDDLRASDGSLTYSGPAAWVRLKPKGNGNQNTLTLNGQVYHLDNSNHYVFLALRGGSMVVHLYNSKAGRGNAMGKWWLAVNATRAKVIICTHQGECTCVEDNS
ncbi:MAG: hypothetical protein FJ291_32110 [Planctomycetes bacterium]|nr:hypothetical protein [Planctomycetota bacterium]